MWKIVLGALKKAMFSCTVYSGAVDYMGQMYLQYYRYRYVQVEERNYKLWTISAPYMAVRVTAEPWF